MENVSFLTRKKITMDKFSSQIKITTENPIRKVLSVDANSVISSCDQLNGAVSINGKIKVNMVYLSKLDEIENSEMYFDFIEKQQQSILLDDIYAEDRLKLKNVSFSGSEAICVFEHNTVLNGNYNYEIPNFSNEDNDFVVKKSNFESQKFVSSVEDNFVVAEEAEVNFFDIKIISTTASVVLSSVSCSVDKIIIEGTVLSNIVYKDAESVGHYFREFEFKQEVQANGILPNMTASAILKVKNATVTPEENDGRTNLVYAFDVFVKGLIYEDYSYEFIEDMFSLSNNIKTTYDYIEAKTYSNFKTYTDTVMLSEDISKLENFDDVLTVYNSKFDFEKVEEGEEKAYIVGNIVSKTLYKTENDVFEIQTNLPVRFEVIKDAGESVGKVEVYPEISSFKVKAGKYLEIIYNIHYMVNFENSVNKKFMKDFEIIGKKQENNSGIKIYITKQGETLFDIAKALSVKPETIESQNDVVDVFEQGEKIYIYSPINLCN